jgi:hypothetical protein
MARHQPETGQEHRSEPAVKDAPDLRGRQQNSCIARVAHGIVTPDLHQGESVMRTIALSLATLGTLLVPCLYAAPAHAQATRTWVSGVGDDVNPCSRTAPCKTFAGAISKTFINGEINCLDPGGFGVVSITKSMTIDCHEIFASILASGTTGVIINIAAGNANDPLREVRLRNLNINGAGASGSVGTRTGISGIRILSAAAVWVEDTLITGFSQKGISDERTTGGKLFVNNSTIRDNGGTGILVLPTSGSTRIDAVVSNSQITGNGQGVSFTNGARAMVNKSVISGNATLGIDAETSAGTVEVNVNDSVSSNNGTGIFTAGAASVRISNTDIAFNATGITGAGVFSFGNNRISGNTAPGSVPALGPASTDHGQQ